MVKTVNTANGTTHFFPVQHHKHTIGNAMAFVSHGTGHVEHAPMVVYFHGVSWAHAQSLESYLTSDQGVWDIRSALRTEKLLLVVPWGGPNSQHGFAPFLSATALTELMQTAMRVAMENGHAKQEVKHAPSPASLVLAGHSGGGWALLKAANTKTAYSRRLTDVWALDCMYWSEGRDWVKWCNANGGQTLHVRAFSKHGHEHLKPKAQADVMLKAPPGNADIQIVNVKHADMPKTYAPEFA
jgi:hypothetical protein